MIVDLRHERVAGKVVRFASLEDRLDPGRLICGLVGGTDPFRGAVDDDIDLSEEVREGPGHRNSGRLHLPAAFRNGGIDRIAALCCHSDVPVEPDVGNTDQGHVALEGDGISYPLPDDAVAIDSHPNMFGVHVMSSVLVCLQHRLPHHPFYSFQSDGMSSPAGRWT